MGEGGSLGREVMGAHRGKVIKVYPVEKKVGEVGRMVIGIGKGEKGA